MKKKVLSILCIIACFLMVFSNVEKVSAEEFEITVESSAKDFAAQWTQYDFKAVIEQNKDTLEAQGLLESYEKYAKLQESLGTESEVLDPTVTYNEEKTEATAKVVISGEKKVQLEMVFDSSLNMLSWDVNEYKASEEDNTSLAAKMKNAGLNTLMGMGTVFLVLIFISFIISLFKYISVFQNRAQKKESKAEAEAPVMETVAEDEELVDDTELVAVITAAIVAASGSASADGLVVRSIRRRY